MIHFWQGGTPEAAKVDYTPCGLRVTDLCSTEPDVADGDYANVWRHKLNQVTCHECCHYFEEPRRPREELTLTIKINPDGSWSANRNMISPDDYPRAIRAVEDMLLNMKEEGRAFLGKRAISKAVHESRCGGCGAPSWMPHAQGCKRG